MVANFSPVVASIYGLSSSSFTAVVEKPMRDILVIMYSTAIKIKGRVAEKVLEIFGEAFGSQSLEKTYKVTGMIKINVSPFSLESKARA